jgi:serine/threonine-protein kinase
MAADLDAIATELALPEFRVPAPSNSAQHRSAATHGRRRDHPSERPAHHPTRQLTLGPGDWSDPGNPAHSETEPDDPDDYEYDSISGEFAGIAISDFIWERQHARRMVLVWVALVLSITGLVATAGWTIGSNLSGLL